MESEDEFYGQGVSSHERKTGMYGKSPVHFIRVSLEDGKQSVYYPFHFAQSSDDKSFRICFRGVLERDGKAMLDDYCIDVEGESLEPICYRITLGVQGVLQIGEDYNGVDDKPNPRIDSISVSKWKVDVAKDLEDRD